MNTQRVDKQSVEEASQEAINRPLDFNPAERAALIRRMLDEIPAAMRREKRESVLKEQFKDFSEYYPELFKKILAKEDLTPMRVMLAMLDRMADGSINQHQASVIVGERLVEKFVKPQLNGTSPSNV
jgi:hypothetical protein